MIKIAVDLSTNKTGIVILDDKKLIYKNDIVFKKFSERAMLENTTIIKNEVNRWFELPQIKNNVNGKIMCGIELSEWFQIQEYNTRFAIYCGVFIGYLYSCELFNNIKVKWFCSNKWQPKINCNNYDKREERKLKARIFANKHCEDYEPNWSEDVCDAFCMSYLLEEIESNEYVKRKKKEKKEFIKKKNAEIRKINLEILKHKNTIKSLKRSKNQMGIFKLENKIKNLNEKKTLLMREINK